MAALILFRRATGQSDQKIRQALMKPKNLPRLHPCADLDGNNLCDVGEVDEAFVVASGGSPGSSQPPPTTAPGEKGSNTFLIITGAGVALAGLLYLSKRGS